MGILENLVDAVSESVKENFKESISDIFDNDKNMSKYAMESPQASINRKSRIAAKEYGTRSNLQTSADNLGDSIDPLKRLGNHIFSHDVQTAKKVLDKGDHILVQRLMYQHHGIYDGNGGVYEYNEGVVRYVCLEDFAGGNSINRKNEYARYSKDEIVRRAQSKLGESEYNLITNNCGHFAIWCRCGD